MASYTPIKSRLIDGGMTSPANAMVAKDFKNIIIIAPLS